MNMQDKFNELSLANANATQRFEAVYDEYRVNAEALIESLRSTIATKDETLALRQEQVDLLLERIKELESAQPHKTTAADAINEAIAEVFKKGRR